MPQNLPHTVTDSIAERICAAAYVLGLTNPAAEVCAVFRKFEKKQITPLTHIVYGQAFSCNRACFGRLKELLSSDIFVGSSQ